MTYHIAKLSRDEVAQGALFSIGDALAQAFSNSSKAILEEGKKGEKEELLIHFDNSATDEAFHEKYGDNVMEILYFNEAAKDVVCNSGFNLNIIGTTEAIPEQSGIMNRTCHFINLH